MAENLPWGEAPEPESCAGSAIGQVGAALWNGASWGPFASPLLSGLLGIGLEVSGWNTVWTKVGKALTEGGARTDSPGDRPGCDPLDTRRDGCDYE